MGQTLKIIPLNVFYAGLAPLVRLVRQSSARSIPRGASFEPLPEHSGWRKREITMIVSRFAKIMLPPAISAILLAGVVWWVTPARLFSAAAELNWPPLVAITAVMVTCLYAWDALCLPTVYRFPGRHITYLQALHLRGLTYLGGALNYELGQGALAWGMARMQGAPLSTMLASSVLLAYHDVMVLLVGGGIGSLLTSDPRVVRLRPIIAVGLLIGVAVGMFVWRLPDQWRARFPWADKNVLFANWSVTRSLYLATLRVGYFSILVVYAAVALTICRLAMDWRVVLSTVPLVLLADGLPSFASLGSREAMLHLTLAPGERNATLVSMSLMWSTGMIVGRLAIATVHMWIHRAGLFGTASAQLAAYEPDVERVAAGTREQSAAERLQRIA
jgi:hypothetical protein